jgi:hypothetical protein
MLSTQLLTSLSVAGVLVVALVAVLATGTSEPSGRQPTASTGISDSPAGMDTPAAEVPASRSSANVDRLAATTRPSGSNVTWLFDLPSIANEEQEWTVGEAQVKGVRYDKSLSVGPGCNSARRDYVISGRHDEFAAMVGMSDLSPETFEIDFYIIADGVTVKTIMSRLLRHRKLLSL